MIEVSGRKKYTLVEKQILIGIDIFMQKKYFFSSSRLIFPQVEEKKETLTMEIRFENNNEYIKQKLGLCHFV